jgi:hypothetical protein
MAYSDSVENPSLAGLWAEKYVRNLLDCSWEQSADQEQAIERLLSSLRFASAQAWAKTEALLAPEMQRNRINLDLIDPWKIAEDSRALFGRATESYQANLPPEKFSRVIAPECGRIRCQYAVPDPRVLGFMSMQFHYTGQILLEQLDPPEKAIFGLYLKVMDDHLYMPLQRSYEAAAQLDYHSAVLGAVRHLLPKTTQIAQEICAEVAKQYPRHRCYGGYLNNTTVQMSSTRDVEMFQTYLCLCVMEETIASVQQELFPLCVLLYPPLKVHWDLVRALVTSLDHKFQAHLGTESYMTFAPYLQALNNMFSLDVFPEDDPVWSNHPDSIRFMDTARNLLQELLGQTESIS